MKTLNTAGKKSKVVFPLKWQYTLIFAGLTALIIGVTIALSSLFLPKYYEYKKLKAYTESLRLRGLFLLRTIHPACCLMNWIVCP